MKIHHNPHSRGFALVATVSMMVLLTLVAIAMLSLSTIEQRSSGGGANDADRMARANARMALMMALGELQKAAELLPNNPIILLSLSRAQIEFSGELENNNAIVNLKNILKNVPENIAAWKLLSIAEARNNNIGLAQLASAVETLEGDTVHQVQSTLVDSPSQNAQYFEDSPRF